MSLATQSENLSPETANALAAIIGTVSMLTGTSLDRDDLSGWIRACWMYLMIEREATLAEVERAFHDHVAVEKWFPRIADLTPRVEALVALRIDAEQIAAAQANAVPVPAIEGDVDWSKVPTRDLPPGYDYADDPHWQAGLAKLQAIHEGNSPASGLGGFVAQIDLNRTTFQGAAKERRQVCPRCDGARWLSLGGWDANDPNGRSMGRPGSRYMRCPVCCPGGIYDEVAERNAMRAAALNGGDYRSGAGS